MSEQVSRKPGERGVALVLFIFLAIGVVIPLIGLGIDGAVLYWEKAKLSSAVDAAALAACRSLSVGQTLSAQATSAQDTGIHYLKANFPDGFLGTNYVGLVPAGTACTGAPGSTCMDPEQSSAVVRTVTVTATINAPVYFMRIAGFNNVQIVANGQASRRDTNVVMVLDRSGSMNGNGNCAAMAADAAQFVNLFSEGRDQVGLITFQTAATLEYPTSPGFGTTFETTFKDPIQTALKSLKCGGTTSTAAALKLAYDQIKAINQPLALNVIFLFTDGSPNGIYADFPIKRTTDIRFNYYGISGSYGPSGCLADTITGSMSADSFSSKGSTQGLWNINPSPPKKISDTSDSSVNGAGCSYYPNSETKAFADVSYVPSVDHWGNSTMGPTSGAIVLGTPDFFPAGSSPEEVGQMRPDSGRTVRYASFSAAYSMARKIRYNTDGLPVVVYTVFLNDGEVENDAFMESISNDPRSPDYDVSRPTGAFKVARNKGELAAAFQEIASQMLHISQ